MKQFEHRGEIWAVRAIGGGFGYGAGDQLPPISNWTVEFTCLSNPSRGLLYAHIARDDPAKESDDALRAALDSALEE